MDFIVNNWPALVIFLAGVAGAGASLVSSQQQDVLTRKLNEKQVEIEGALSKQLDLSEKIISSGIKIETVQTKNVSLAEENARLSAQLRGLLTGGDSYAHLVLMSKIERISNGHIAEPSLAVGYEFHGQYPLRNVTITIMNRRAGEFAFWEAKLKGGKDISEANIERNRARMVIEKKYDELFPDSDGIVGRNKVTGDIVHPMTHLGFELPPIPEGKAIAYNYKIRSLNHRGSEGTIFIRRNSEGSIESIRLLRVGEDKYTSSPKDYVKLSEGGLLPDWDELKMEEEEHDALIQSHTKK